MFEFIRAAAAVPKLSVGDTAYNTAEIISKAEEAVSLGAGIVAFPELCLTGYTCADLFFQTTLQHSVLTALKKLSQFSSGNNCTLIVGAPLNISGQLYNCGIVISCGKLAGIVPKTFLPNYNESFEKRWFSSSEQLTQIQISSAALGFDESYSIPVGRNLIFSLGNDVKFGVEICEDLCSPIPPSSFLALNGAELIINLSASNETSSKRTYRRELVRHQSAAQLCGYIYASAGSDESTTDLVFTGHSLIAENGAVICESNEYTNNNFILIKDIDIGKIRADRLKNKSFSDCASLYADKEPCMCVNMTNANADSDGSLYAINPSPFISSSKQKTNETCMNIFHMQSLGLAKRLHITGGKMVVGISGGLDSTLALLVCANTAKMLNKPMTDIVGITMPCFGTSDRTHNNALKLMQILGITSTEISIKEACTQHFRDIGQDINIHDLTYENAQARERTQVLMDYAGKIGGLVIGTGDLSELALGWCTYNGDHMSMYGVNSSIPKTLIPQIIESIIEHNIFPDAEAVLKDIIDTPISPELIPPDEHGNIVQSTEEIVGPYELHDFFLYYIIRYGFEPAKIYHLAKIAFKEKYNNAVILKWLKNFYRRFFTQQFKRSCAPDGVKAGSIGLSPRGDWKMPSDASVRLWLDEAEKL